MNRALLITLLALSACSVEEKSQSGETSASKLDKQAIAAGILLDSKNLSLSGQFETRSELGVDKFCATNSGSDFDIGMLAVFGPESKCEARGTARINGEKIDVTLSGKEGCKFSAIYDGTEISVPGALEEGCSSYCSPRASFSGTSYFMVSQGDDAARKSLGRDFKRLCGN